MLSRMDERLVDTEDGESIDHRRGFHEVRPCTDDVDRLIVDSSWIRQVWCKTVATSDVPVERSLTPQGHAPAAATVGRCPGRSPGPAPVGTVRSRTGG